MHIYYTVISIAYYMFRPPNVTTFMAVLFEGILHRTLKYVNLTCYICKLF
jgi:hypothetical protein